MSDDHQSIPSSTSLVSSNYLLPDSLKGIKLYNKTSVANILYLYANTDMPLADILKAVKPAIKKDAWYSIVKAQSIADLWDQAARARSNLLFTDGIDNLNAKIAKFMELEAPNLNYDLIKGWMQAFRIRLETIKYRIEKGNPGKYGPKMEVSGNLTIVPGKLQADAWRKRQEMIAEQQANEIKQLSNGDGKTQDDSNQ